MGKEKLLLATGLGLLAIALVLGVSFAYPILGYQRSPYSRQSIIYRQKTGRPADQIPFQMMGGNIGGMMGGGSGMMRGMMGRRNTSLDDTWISGCPMANYGLFQAGAKTRSIEQTIDDIRDYLKTLDDPNLALGEVWEFENTPYYAVIVDKKSAQGAFEILIDQNTGNIYPEMGPNMMWNTKYGHMATGGEPERLVTERGAKDLAQKFLNANYPGATTSESHEFPGYYTFHVNKGSETKGMLSVHQTTGQVWYHSWHGIVVQIRTLIKN